MHEIELFVATYGPLVVLVGAFFEGEIVVAMGGFAAHQGLMSAWIVALCAFIGSFSSDQLIFLAARRNAERPWLMRLRTRTAFARAVAALRRHPALFIVSFRFIYGLRTVGPAAVSIAGISARRYLWLNALSAACWAVAFTALGYVFGHAAEAAVGTFMRFEERALAALAIAGVILLIAAVSRALVLRRLRASSRDAQKSAPDASN
jgi:membrane protein DedA with SNARE-associated domain